MKKLLILFLLAAAPCQAEIISKLSSSTSLTVGASSTQATRVPSTYAVSGTNIKVSTGEHIGKLTAGSATADPAVSFPICSPVLTFILVPDTA